MTSQTNWIDLDVVLLNAKGTAIIGRANVSFSDRVERPQSMIIEGHSFFIDLALSTETCPHYRHMVGCGSPDHKKAAR